MKKLFVISFLAMMMACSTHETEYTWVEEFDSVCINQNIWSKIPEGEHDWNRHMSMDDDLFDIKNGCLILKGDISEDSVIRTGGIFSKGKKDFGYGRIDIRAKLQGAKGEWPAFWMWPVERDNPLPYAEIDISERLNFDPFSYQTIHTAYNLKPEKDVYQKKSATGNINPDDFNIYSVEHFKDSIKLYINDSLTLKYVRMPVAPDGTKLPENEQWPFDQRFFLILDMQIAGKWVGDPDKKDYPVELQIDWIRYKEFSE